jgi:hypothetical protein
MTRPGATITINVELDIGEGLRKTLVALGWTPPGETSPPPNVGLHDFIAEQPARKHCLLYVAPGRVCDKGPNDPVHQPLAQWERDLLDEEGHADPRLIP